MALWRSSSVNKEGPVAKENDTRVESLTASCAQPRSAFDMSVQVSFEAPIWVFAYALK